MTEQDVASPTTETPPTGTAPASGGTLRRYARVVAVPGRSPLVPIGVVARLPLGAYSIALFFLARTHGTSYGFAGRMVATFTVSNAIGAVAQGRLVDAYGPRRVLSVAGAVHGAALLGLVPLVRTGGPAAYALAVLAGACVPQTSAALRAYWTRVLPTELRPTAYAMESTIVDTLASLGPALVSALLVIGLRAPVVGCALTAGLGTVMFALCDPLRLMRGTRRFSFSAGPLVQRGVALRVLTGALLGFVAGVAEIGAASSMTAAHHARAAGVVIAAFSIGSAVSGVWYGARAWGEGAPSRHPYLLLAGMGLATGLLAATQAWQAIGPTLLVVGAFFGPAYIALAVDLSTLSTENVAELYTFLVTGAIGGQSAGAAVAGFVADAWGPWRTFVVAAAVGLAGACLVFLPSTRAARAEGGG